MVHKEPDMAPAPEQQLAFLVRCERVVIFESLRIASASFVFQKADPASVGAMIGSRYRERGAHVDFGFSEEQEMLRQSARALLEKECPSAVVRKLMDDERGLDPALWKKMAELGWLGLVIPEKYGGGGLSYVDLVLIM